MRLFFMSDITFFAKSGVVFRLKERPLYRPFKDEEILAKEIPLMQAIAEEIIIKTVEEIKL